MAKTGNECLLGHYMSTHGKPLLRKSVATESETYNALVVMVGSGERSTRSTERITERDTAQTERTLDKACDHSTPAVLYRAMSKETT